MRIHTRYPFSLCLFYFCSVIFSYYLSTPFDTSYFTNSTIFAINSPKSSHPHPSLFPTQKSPFGKYYFYFRGKMPHRYDITNTTTQNRYPTSNNIMEIRPCYRRNNETTRHLLESFASHPTHEKTKSEEATEATQKQPYQLTYYHNSKCTIAKWKSLRPLPISQRLKNRYCVPNGDLA